MKKSYPFAVFAALAVTSPLHATIGYFDHGYGVKSKGAGGTGVADPQDALAPATNPAGLAFVEDRFDFGLSFFQPDRSADLYGSEYDGNGKHNFYIPEIGFKTHLNENIHLGLAIYGNGGLNTDYQKPLYDQPPTFGNTTDAGVDLLQLFIAPTLAYKINANHAIGVTPILAIQRFEANGLEDFGVESSGYDTSYGGGVRIGYTGKLTDWLTIGASYQSRIYASRFDDYSTLFAEGGDFDIPSNYTVGFALHPVEKLTFAFDVQRIHFSEVNSVGNDLSFERFSKGLGADEGPGFGWRDVTAFKTGVSYEVTEALTLRLGYIYNTQPIRENQTYFNVLAPAVIQHHVTAGVTWKINKNWETSAFYTHGFKETVKGSGNAFGSATDADLTMEQNSFGLSVSRIF
ncbi:MAG: outer membrane protein transport protein [Luteolibacter sp.]